MVYKGHSEGGAAMTQLILASFPFHGALMAAGERLTKSTGLTSARWQVLSAVVRAERLETVANISRIMGLTRQAVQRVADDLEKHGFVTFEPNPHHKRAQLVAVTAEGLRAFELIKSRQVPWANVLATQIDASELKVATGVLAKLKTLMIDQFGE